MNVQQQTIVALDVAYAAKRGGGVIAGYHEAHLLDTGAIAIFDDENNLLQTTTVEADLKKVQQFFFAQGGVDQASSPKLSMRVDRNAYTQWYNAYAAPVLQKSRIGKVATVGSLNLGTLANGTFATVIVTDQPSIGQVPNRTKRYTVPVIAADTATTLLTKLVTVINANADSIVTATRLNDATNDYLQLEAKAVGTSFTIGVDDVLLNATRSEHGTNGTTDNFSGFGTLTKVKAAVLEDKLTRGDEYRLHARNVPDGAGYNSYVEVTDGLTSGNFNGWTFQWAEEATRAANKIHTSNPVVALFLEDGGAGEADITTIIELVLDLPSTGSGSSASGSSSGETDTVAGIPAGGEG